MTSSRRTRSFWAGQPRCWRLSRLRRATSRRGARCAWTQWWRFDTNRRVKVTTLFQDLRYALRMFARNPGFAAFAVAILALGIGANTAIFSVAYNVLLRPLPYHDANRLVMIWEDSSAFGFPKDTPAPGNFFSWKSENHVFEDMAAI